ncbi:hypothetical protein D3C75_765070 [compost metagenome]
MCLVQRTLDHDTLAQLAQHHATKGRQPHQQQQQDRHRLDRIVPPGRDDRLPRQARLHYQRVAAQRAKAIQPWRAVHHGDRLGHPFACIRQVVAEDLAAAQAAPHHLLDERPPYQDGAVALGQHQRATFVDLEVAVVAHEPLHLDGAQQHPGEAAIGILQAP